MKAIISSIIVSIISLAVAAAPFFFISDRVAFGLYFAGFPFVFCAMAFALTQLEEYLAAQIINRAFLERLRKIADIVFALVLVVATLVILYNLEGDTRLIVATVWGLPLGATFFGGVILIDKIFDYMTNKIGK